MLTAWLPVRGVSIGVQIPPALMVAPPPPPPPLGFHVPASQTYRVWPCIPSIRLYRLPFVAALQANAGLPVPLVQEVELPPFVKMSAGKLPLPSVAAPPRFNCWPAQ